MNDEADMIALAREQGDQPLLDAIAKRVKERGDDEYAEEIRGKTIMETMMGNSFEDYFPKHPDDNDRSNQARYERYGGV